MRNRNVKSFNSTNRPNLRYPFYVNLENPDENGLFEVSAEFNEEWTEVMASTVDGLDSVWRWGKEKAQKQKSDLTAYKGTDGNIRIFQKERKLTQTAKTTWDSKNFHSIKGTRELTELLGKSIFDFPKPEMLIRQVLTIGTNEDDIILDSFAGSGTTAHAVLNLNKADGGNRKFIIIEMEDYANSITAERVKRVINGYGDKEGTGGSFDFYELGPALFLEDGNLNEAVGIDRIREYIWYSETQKPFTAPTSTQNEVFLGIENDTAFYFYYAPDEITSLDHEFLASIKTKAEQYVIYADNCLLTKEFMAKYHIIFKKIPRDITRF